MAGTGLFLRSMFSQMSQTGAFSPSSRNLARAMADAIPPLSPVRVLEVGAGTGALTKEIASRLRSGDRLDLCEINPEFADHLRNAFRRPLAGPDVTVLECDVSRLGGNVRYDVIASSIPLLNMEPDAVSLFFASMLGKLADGGTLVYWDYLGKELWASVGFWRSRARKQAVLEATERVLRAHERSRRTVFGNLPPAVVHYLKT